MAIKNIWGKESTQFFQEMRKTKFHASKKFFNAATNKSKEKYNLKYSE